MSKNLPLQYDLNFNYISASISAIQPLLLNKLSVSNSHQVSVILELDLLLWEYKEDSILLVMLALQHLTVTATKTS